MKKVWIVMILILLLAGCTNQPADELAVPTRIHTPTQTATPIPTTTSTPIVVWEQVLPDYSAEPPPNSNLEVITTENVQQLEEVDRWGKGWVDGMALSPDGKTIAVSTGTGILFYDAQSMKQIKKFSFCEIADNADCEESIGSIDNIDFNPDGQSLVIGRDTIYQLDLDFLIMSELIPELEEYDDSRIVEIQFNHDGNRLVVIRYYEFRSFQPIYANLEIYETADMGLIFKNKFRLSDDINVMGLTNDNIVQYMGLEVNMENGKILSESPRPFPKTQQPIEISYLDDGTRVVESSNDSNSCQILIDGSTSSHPRLFDMSQNTKKAIMFAEDGSTDLLILDFEACKVNHEYLSLPQPFREIEFSQNGNYIISGNTSGWYKYIWDVRSRSVALPLRAEIVFLNETENEVYAIVEDYPDKIRLVNTTSNEVIFEMSTEGIYSDYILYQTNDRFIASSAGKVIDFPSGKLVITEQYFDLNSYFVNNGEKLFLYTNWDHENREMGLNFVKFNSWEVLPELYQKIILPDSTDEYSDYPYSINISSDWNYFAFFYDRHIYIWDLEKQEMVSLSKEIEYITDHIKFSPDENLLYTTQYYNDKSLVQVWEVETGEQLYEFNVPLNLWVYSIAVSPDGKLLAFLANDGTIRIYGVR